MTGYPALFVLAGVLALLLAEQCRRDPEQLKKKFITESGGPFSVFALPYITRPAEGRRAVVEQLTLRRLRLLEMYLHGVLLILGGIWLLWG
jgi:hypothetical protein